MKKGVIKENKKNILVLEDLERSIEEIKLNGIEKTIYPLEFPVRRVFLDIESDDGEYKLEIKSNGNLFEFMFSIENGTLVSDEIEDKEVEVYKVSIEKIEKRKMMACELFGSDEIFLELLGEVTDDIEHAFDEGEELSVDVAEKTIFIHDDEQANNYINYFVVRSPESVQKKILKSYKL